jgi:hypothetical protein
MMHVRDVENGNAVVEKECPTGHHPNTCAWSLDGARLAAGLADGTVRVWCTATWREVAKLEGHGGPVRMCAWSPDGFRLATASDQSVRVSEVVTWSTVVILEGHTDDVDSCAWSPDGTRLASGSDDNTMLVWLAPPVTLEQVRRWAVAAEAARAEQARVTAERSALDLAGANTRAEAADTHAAAAEEGAAAAYTRAWRLEGDPQALHQCSLEVETHIYCPPRHRMALNSRLQGPECVSPTWQKLSARPYLGDLRHLVGDIDRARSYASSALSWRESLATESVAVAEINLCHICHERRKDTALNCGHLLCGVWGLRGAGGSVPGVPPRHHLARPRVPVVAAHVPMLASKHPHYYRHEAPHR